MMNKKIRLISLLVLIFSIYGLQLFSQNVALNFDGRNYVELTSLTLPQYKYTVEGWFKSTSTSSNVVCNGSQGEILWFEGNASAGSFVALGECNGELFFLHEDLVTSTYLSASVPHSIRGSWRHISVHLAESSGGIIDVEVYLDCTLVISGTVGRWDINNEFILGQIGARNPLSNFRGDMDDVKIYGSFMPPNILCQDRRCIIDDPARVGLLAYYTFDEGKPGMDNSSIVAATDYSGNGGSGKLNNFRLQGTTSNYVASTSPIFPRTDLYCPLITSVPFRKDTISKICNEDVVHLCLTDTAGVSLSALPPELDEVKWFYSTDGTTWNLISQALLDLTCGVVPQGSISIDCTTSTLGYEDWEVRSEFKYKDGSDSCYHYTKSVPLRVCCGLDDLGLQGSTNFPGDLLCDMDVVDFALDVSPNYPFLTNPASGVRIRWSYNGSPLPAYDDLTQINYNNITVDVNQGACFKVDVNFGICDKQTSLQYCFPIDPMPICGTIDTLINPTVLTQISVTPKVYEICPGEDAALKIDLPFMNCIPTWEYSFDLSSWTGMGSTNRQQNTNVIPTAAWPGSNIYYRIKCDPINMPSGCEPCYSDTLEIRLSAPPIIGTITGKDQICCDETTIYTHVGHDPSLTNQWYCNGIPVGNGGMTLQASMEGCYWVESTDSCHTISTPVKCLEVCKIEAVISCPDVCPKLGTPIILSACDSVDSCGLPLTYQWSVTGANTPTIAGCNVTHIPDAAGTTYTVKVTNALGCMQTASVTIVPCN